MTRVKRGVISTKRRRSVLKLAKGFRHGKKSKERQAKELLAHAGVHAFNHRKQKKGDFRRQWQVVINAGVRPHGLSYSAFAGLLKKAGVALDRKILATLARENPDTFSRIVARVK